MIVFRFSGGLGNQLFQYALFKKYEALGRTVKADFRSFDNQTERRELYFPKLGVNLKTATHKELSKYDPNYCFINKIRHKIGQLDSIFDNPTYMYNESVLKVDDVFVDGYWQCPKYFDDIRGDIISSIIFPKLPDEQEKIRRKMINENAVSVHVRLGDYLQFGDKYGNICTKDYYNSAFEYLEKNDTNLVYYGFSDNPEMASELVGNRNIIWMNANSEEDAYNDLNLMKACKHNIIANSSFSWWGAYLGERENKIVIAPSRWTNSNSECDIWCDGWVKK